MHGNIAIVINVVVVGGDDSCGRCSGISAADGRGVCNGGVVVIVVVVVVVVVIVRVDQ